MTVGIFGTSTINMVFYVSSRVIIDFFDRKNLRNWRTRSTKEAVQDATAIGVVMAPATKQAIHKSTCAKVGRVLPLPPAEQPCIKAMMHGCVAAG